MYLNIFRVFTIDVMTELKIHTFVGTLGRPKGQLLGKGEVGTSNVGPERIKI